MNYLPRGAIGLALIALEWPASWLRVGLLGECSFFPLWLGYILTVDALVLRRTGTSMLNRNARAFMGMFLFSVPMWWLFEGIDHFTQNWHYVGTEDYSTLRYALVASWHFSIVIPAVFETAELVGSVGLVKRLRRGPSAPLFGKLLAWPMALEALSLTALVAWPRYAFPVTWLSVFLVLDPANCLLGRPSIVARLREGDWRPVVVMVAAALICGLFWEMWNYWAYPKWHYTIPFVDYARVFEMPLLGYGGYLPFGLEVYAVYHFLAGFAGSGRVEHPVYEAHYAPVASGQRP